MTTNAPLERHLKSLFVAGLLGLAAFPAFATPPVSDQEAAALAAIMPPAVMDAPVAPAATAATDGPMQGLLRRAFSLLGTPYRWGGSSPDRGFDCSGLVGYVYRTALGIDLPRISQDQAHAGERVADRAAMAAGDLVFFGRRGRVDHVGIYIGEGKFVHAPSRGKDVMVSSLDEGYWGSKFMQARRVAL